MLEVNLSDFDTAIVRVAPCISNKCRCFNTADKCCCCNIPHSPLTVMVCKHLVRFELSMKFDRTDFQIRCFLSHEITRFNCRILQGQWRRRGATVGGDMNHFGGDEDHFKSIFSCNVIGVMLKAEILGDAISSPSPVATLLNETVLRKSSNNFVSLYLFRYINGG